MKVAMRTCGAAALLVAGLSACERAAPARVEPRASAGSSAVVVSAPVDAAAPPSLPPEPPCPAGTGPVRISVCREPAAGDAAPGYPAPYARCLASHEGHPFSPELTAAERGRGADATCCYLDRCQISYGY